MALLVVNFTAKTGNRTEAAQSSSPSTHITFGGFDVTAVNISQAMHSYRFLRLEREGLGNDVNVTLLGGNTDVEFNIFLDEEDSPYLRRQLVNGTLAVGSEDAHAEADQTGEILVRVWTPPALPIPEDCEDPAALPSDYRQTLEYSQSLAITHRMMHLRFKETAITPTATASPPLTATQISLEPLSYINRAAQLHLLIDCADIPLLERLRIRNFLNEYSEGRTNKESLRHLDLLLRKIQHVLAQSTAAGVPSLSRHALVTKLAFLEDYVLEVASKKPLDAFTAQRLTYKERFVEITQVMRRFLSSDEDALYLVRENRSPDELDALEDPQEIEALLRKILLRLEEDIGALACSSAPANVLRASSHAACIHALMPLATYMAGVEVAKCHHDPKGPICQK